jgi:hypothetical protein
VGHVLAGKADVPVIETTLIVTRAGNTATLQWKSDPRVFYTVVYASRKDAKAEWKPLPGYVKIRGSGETITITDKVPFGEKRHYRLHVEPIALGR